MSDFSPFRFHPTRYAEDPYDLLLPLRSRKHRRIKTHCTECGLSIERDAERRGTGRGVYRCLDCKQKKDREDHKTLREIRKEDA